MGWLQIAGAILQIIVWILNAIKEHSDDVKKEKTELIQSAARAIIDRDATRYTGVLDNINRLYPKTGDAPPPSK